MKKFFTIFFITLGVIFTILLLLVAYIFATDTWGIKSMLFGSANTTVPAGTVSTDSNPLLSDDQEQTLRNIGVDPAALPGEITEEQLRCFENILGTDRVNEIKTGATPTAAEFFKARSCI